MKKILLFTCLLILVAGCAHLRVRSKKVSFMELEIAKTCTAVKDGYFQNAKSEFSVSRDANVYAFVRFKYVDNKPYKVQFEWFGPSGRYHQSEPQVISSANSYYENVSLFQSLDVRNMAEYGLLGDWRTLIKVDGQVVHTLEFSLVR